jgi:hypothetical protein
MGAGWIDRIDDNDQQWLEDQLKDYHRRFNISFQMCGNSSGSMYFYNIKNDMWPSQTSDMFDWPKNPFSRSHKF